MTRAHVRLLGPCFKTGRTGDRPIRHRPRAPCDAPPTPTIRGLRALTTVPAIRTDDRIDGGRPGPRSCLPRSADGPTPPASVTPHSCERGHLPRGLLTADEPVVALRAPKVHPSPHAHVRTGLLADVTMRPPHGRRIESDARTLRSSPFASKRFHVLLNSLFKVLFNFPSRYLFAIGLVSVFSLRWSLPPALGCILKQPDSEDVAGTSSRRRRGLTPAMAKPQSGGLGRRSDAHALVLNTTVRDA